MMLSVNKDNERDRVQVNLRTTALSKYFGATLPDETMYAQHHLVNEVDINAANKPVKQILK